MDDEQINNDLIEATSTTSTLALVDRDFEPDGAVLILKFLPGLRACGPDAIRPSAEAARQLRAHAHGTAACSGGSTRSESTQSTRVRTAAVHPSSGPLQWRPPGGRAAGGLH